MQNLEQTAQAWELGALVFVQESDDTAAVRPAAFVFETDGGLLWVEPSYADPAGAPVPAVYQREGQILADGRGFDLRTARGQLITVLPYEADDRDMVGDALEWFAGFVAASGRTWAEERERVRALVFPDSAGPA